MSAVIAMPTGWTISPAVDGAVSVKLAYDAALELDGDPEGLPDGEVDGLLEGEPEGLPDGEVGEAEGEPDGDPEGETGEAEEVPSDGLALGELDGVPSDGEAEGVLSDGDAEGDDEGAFVVVDK